MVGAGVRQELRNELPVSVVHRRAAGEQLLERSPAWQAMLAREHQFNTLEQVRGYLQAALDLVDELGPPDDLAPEFFAKAVDLLAQKHVFFETAQMGAPIDLSNHRRPR